MYRKILFKIFVLFITLICFDAKTVLSNDNVDLRREDYIPIEYVQCSVEQVNRYMELDEKAELIAEVAMLKCRRPMMGSKFLFNQRRGVLQIGFYDYEDKWIGLLTDEFVDYIKHKKAMKAFELDRKAKAIK